jgi:hypothetical protein
MNMSHYDDLVEKESPQLEAGSPLANQMASDEIVDWDCSTDTANPMNWSKGKHWAHVIMVAILGLIP